MAKKRYEIPSSDRWNVEAMYPNQEAWENDLQLVLPASQTYPMWPDLAAFRGQLDKGAEVVKAAIEELIRMERKLTKLYVYAHLRQDEELTNDQAKTAFGRVAALWHDYNQEISWFDPELLSLPEATLESYMKAESLAPYHFLLEKLIRQKKHRLSEEGELLMALSGQALSAPHKAFSAISDADFKFPKVKNAKGEEKELTHGQYGLYIRDQDRTLRQNAFSTYHKQYEQYENTFCELLQGQVQKNVFNARARKYASALDAALFPHNVDIEVYHSLIQTVNSRIGSLHRYLDLRKKVLGLDELHLYDMYVPLTKDIDIRMPYSDAEDIIVRSVAPLGNDYQKTLAKGFKEQRWVDRYENESKRSGAYSSGCYDSMPYILMNYKDMLRDVCTLAHEAGHSMHSYLSREHQPFHYSDYPIFLAEVASTFNEELLMTQLMQNFANKEEQIFLINQKIEDIRGTLFRQTMFAEFELLIHQLVEANQPLTPRLLKEKYAELNAKYFGPNAVIDPEITIEWARIPHFYYNFYVYQYATGISAALALARRVQQGGEKERNDYLTFLQGGGSKYPLELLQQAGVDMRSSAPVNAAIDRFDQLLGKLEDLLLSEKTEAISSKA